MNLTETLKGDMINSLFESLYRGYDKVTINFVKEFISIYDMSTESLLEQIDSQGGLKRFGDCKITLKENDDNWLILGEDFNMASSGIPHKKIGDYYVVKYEE